MRDDAYRFEFRPGTIRHGPDAVADLGAELDRHGLSRALVVTGSTVGSTPAVMDPVRDGLGDRLVGVFDETTTEKYLGTACEAARLVREADVDALVSVGGGSSLDTAKIVSVLAGFDRPLDDVVAEIVEREAMLVPEDGPLTDVFAVPTTLPGADLTQMAGVKLAVDPGDAPLSEIPSGGVSDERLMPTAVFHDVSLVGTTPDRILATSAMNGFDKGVEMLYTRDDTPVTDAAAMRGLRLLQASLPAIGAGETSDADLSDALKGVALAQYGLSTPTGVRASIIHAFGHALSRSYDVQQGAAHAIAAPHVLRYVFDEVDGRRDLLAEALAVDDGTADDEATAAAVVGAVEDVRDALGLPSRLRSVEGAERDHFPRLARAVVEDSFLPAAPRGLDPGRAEIEAVFDAMW